MTAVLSQGAPSSPPPLNLQGGGLVTIGEEMELEPVCGTYRGLRLEVAPRSAATALRADMLKGSAASRGCCDWG